MTGTDRERALFDRALQLPEKERLPFIESECGGDHELCGRLQALLKAHEDAMAHESRFSVDETLSDFQDEIDGYRILGVLNEGGMGIVLLAMQTAPVQRKVAIKIIKPGMDTREVLARFELEMRALSMMTHPNIARIISAGQSRNGRPYFVMEYVPGQPITEFCNTHQLGLNERLELLMTVCLAVQHAHQRGIIHRDLKPANILVYEQNGSITAKIIDFGIAKAVHGHLTDASLHTRMGGLIGTPDYMSPEQADPFTMDVDTRADVYSLGAVLYHLLADRPPLELQKKDSYHEIQKALSETLPERPSTLALRRRSDKTSTHGGDELVPQRKIKGELDWICMKALAKQRSQRYGSAQELADDLKRYLTNIPVLAAPPSRLYAIGKFVERNRLSSALAVLALVLAGSFAVQSYRQYQIIKEERDKASYQASVLKQVSGFLVNLFRASNPGHGGHREASAGELLEKAKTKLLIDLPTPSAERIYMFESLSNVYAGIGRFAEAREYAFMAESDAIKVHGENSSEYLDTALGLMRLLAALRDWPVILEKSPRLLRVNEIVTGKPDETGAMLESIHAVALMNTGRHEDAIVFFESAIPVLEASQGKTGSDVLSAKSDLTYAYYLAGRMDDAFRLATDLLPAAENRMGREHSITLTAKYDLAIQYKLRDNETAARELLADVIETRARLYGENHRTTLAARSLMTDMDPDNENKRTMLASIYAQQTEKLGISHRDTLDTRARIIAVEWILDRNPEKTIRDASSLMDSMKTVVSTRHDKLVETRLVLADACLAAGLDEEARQHYLEAKLGGASARMLRKHPDLVKKIPF